MPRLLGRGTTKYENRTRWMKTPIFLLKVPFPEIKSQAGADDKSIRIQILHPIITVIQEIITNIGIENEVWIQGKI